MKTIQFIKIVTLACSISFSIVSAFAVNSHLETNSLGSKGAQASAKNNLSAKLVKTSAKDSPLFLSWNDIVGVSPKGLTAAHGISINPLSHNLYVVGATDKGLYDSTNPNGKETMYFIRKYEMSIGNILNKTCADVSQCYRQWPYSEDRSNSKYIAKAVDASTAAEFVVGDRDYIYHDENGKPVKASNYFITKYSSDLQLLIYNEGSSIINGHQIRAFGVAKDTFEIEPMVYVVGCTNVQMPLSKDPQTGISDYYITGINSNTLNPIWVRQYGSVGGSACARSVQVDNSSGDAYIAGFITNASGKTSAFLTAYSNTGHLSSTRQYLGGNGDTRAYGVAIDQKRGLLYVVGSTNEKLGDDPITSDQAMFVAQYRLGSLELNWVKTFGAKNYWGKTTALSVTVADDEYVYITGFTNSPLYSMSPKSVQHGKTDTFVLVLDNFGSPSNYVQIGGENKRRDPGTTDGQSIAVDSNKYVFVTGFTDAGFLGESVKGLLDYFLTEVLYNK